MRVGYTVQHKCTVKPVYSDHISAAKGGLSRQVVSLQRSKSFVPSTIGTRPSGLYREVHGPWIQVVDV